MAYRPGELDQRIIIERETLTPDGMGGDTSEWDEHLTRWALVRPASGGEKTEHDTVNANAKYMFVIRYPADVKDDDRILWDGDYYNIRLRNKPKTRGMYMAIEAERGVAQ
jgi:SPP1 family predicted phage head-tail adaptor